MRSLFGFGLIAFGAYWFWKKLDERESNLDDAVPTLADRIRATLEESGIRQGRTKLRNGGLRAL